MKDSLYEQNFKLHSENARLRKKIEQLEASLGIDKIREHFDAEIQKHLRKEEKLQKESDRYHQLWQNAVSELRSKGDVLELLIQIEDLEKLCEQLRQEISALTNENTDLKNKCEHLLHQLHRDYENSSLPSSAKPNHKKSKTAENPLPANPGPSPVIPGTKGLIWNLRIFKPFLFPKTFSIIPTTT